MTGSSLPSFVGCSCRGSADAELQAAAAAAGDGHPGLKAAVRLVLVVVLAVEVVVEEVVVGEVVEVGAVAAVKPVDKW